MLLHFVLDEWQATVITVPVEQKEDEGVGEVSRGSWLAKGMEKRLGRVSRQSGAQTGSKGGGTARSIEGRD